MTPGPYSDRQRPTDFKNRGLKATAAAKLAVAVSIFSSGPLRDRNTLNGSTVARSLMSVLLSIADVG